MCASNLLMVLTHASNIIYDIQAQEKWLSDAISNNRNFNYVYQICNNQTVFVENSLSYSANLLLNKIRTMNTLKCVPKKI